MDSISLFCAQKKSGSSFLFSVHAACGLLLSHGWAMECRTAAPVPRAFMVGPWMLLRTDALAPRTSSWFGHGCAGSECHHGWAVDAMHQFHGHHHDWAMDALGNGRTGPADVIIAGRMKRRKHRQCWCFRDAKLRNHLPYGCVPTDGKHRKY